MSRRTVIRGATAALALTAALAACSLPVRFAGPSSSSKSASPSPATSSPAPATSPGGTSATPAPAPASGSLSQLQDEYRRVIDFVLPSVVEIDTASGLGSGVVLDNQGDIVTNAHVVGTDTRFTVITANGQNYAATLVGSYPANDLAVVKVGGDVTLTPAKFADSSKVHLGDIVLAVGSPLGLEDSVSQGIVSGIGRQQPEGNGVTLNDLIQTTAALNPGNSGGALVDITGAVIGIPTLSGGSGRGGSATNIGFAIPSNQVKTITGQLVSGGGSVTHTGQPYIGVQVSDSPNGGAEVQSVVAGGPADKAGVKAGWVIVDVDGHSIPDGATLSQVLANYKPGDKVTVTAKATDGSTKKVTVTVGERPANP